MSLSKSYPHGMIIWMFPVLFAGCNLDHSNRQDTRRDKSRVIEILDSHREELTDLIAETVRVPNDRISKPDTFRNAGHTKPDDRQFAANEFQVQVEELKAKIRLECENANISPILANQVWREYLGDSTQLPPPVALGTLFKLIDPEK